MKLFGTELSPRGFFIFAVGVGSLAGLALGGLLGGGASAFLYAPLWMIALATLLGGLVLYERRNAPPAPAAAGTRARQPAARAAPAPAQAGALKLIIDMPEIPAGYPPVVGDKEEVLVRIRVNSEGAPAEGAAVRLVGNLRDGGRVVVKEGVTGSGGSVAFTFKPQGTGELILEAEASLDRLQGRTTTTVGVVLYEEEIERLFGEFRTYATGVLGPDAHADTARELAERLRRDSDAPTGRALLELARIYELVAYGERPADRRLYLALVGSLLVLEGAEMPESSPRRLPAGG